MKDLGKIAYEAYFKATPEEFRDMLPSWDEADLVIHESWTYAANAVADAVKEESA